MANTTSPNMGLIVPGIGTEPGPTWASDLNASLGILDQHNHTSGQGIQIPTNGLNINADLPFNGSNARALKAVIFNSQSSPIGASAPYLGCIYVSGVDLYYNDGSGNQIRLTQGGSITGTSGSIANLTSPASATYVSGTSTFVWQSAASTPANLDAASIILRNLTASSNGVTLSPVNSLSSNYTLVLPTPPASQSFLAIDNGGNITANAAVSGGLTSSNLSPTAGITGSQLANQTVTTTQIANGAVTTTQISASAGILTTQLAAQNYSNSVSTTITAATLTTAFMDICPQFNITTGGARYVLQQFYTTPNIGSVTLSCGTSGVVSIRTTSNPFGVNVTVAGTLTLDLAQLNNLSLGGSPSTQMLLSAKYVSGGSVTMTVPAGITMNAVEL